ncbi:hypothetical protein K493DRAFT_303159 [Basidiobolus meristosporus CBS 931.73]|uniref:Mitochondrial carrier n=1 Tax=Basidiobolus meristosporus CBS 931.73 TaxID=1314790 RepID=A0A1Y1Y3W8_9FUNG|nr:hypothetical protein K493DRAFT_303159 [Basidiobolus meristosporus CBS 931.73]|eukprot:ORX92688.1 hypothetical protein K493DRAFT_303159 [Basidiobolus meristosporus CBS 931.73]
MDSKTLSTSSLVKAATYGTVQTNAGPKYNYNGLLLTDLSAALVSSTFVSPLVAIIDKSVVSNASGRQSLGEGLKAGLKDLFTAPHKFFRQPTFMIMFAVYSGTYAIANWTETICNHYDQPWQFPKFVTSSIANIGLSLLRDKLLAQWFGSSAKARPLPPLSYGCFVARDCLTIAASFNLPPAIAPWLQKQVGWTRDNCEIAAQLITPVGVQFLSTPLHLTGLDLYNRPGIAAAQRIAFLKKETGPTTAIRMVRILPAFSLGGVANKWMRMRGKEYFREN